MTLREMIYSVDKSNNELKDDVFLHSFAEEHLNINMYLYEWNYELDNTRLVSYWLRVHYCTDAWVGVRVYYFDDEPVAISHKPYRKADEELEWISAEAYNKVKEYAMESTTPNPDRVCMINNLDECIDSFGYRIDYCSQILPYHEKNAFINGEKVEIIGYEERTNTIQDLISDRANVKFSDGRIEFVSMKDIYFPFNITKQDEHEIS